MHQGSGKIGGIVVIERKGNTGPLNSLQVWGLTLLTSQVRSVSCVRCKSEIHSVLLLSVSCFDLIATRSVGGLPVAFQWPGSRSFVIHCEHSPSDRLIQPFTYPFIH